MKWNAAASLLFLLLCLPPPTRSLSIAFLFAGSSRSFVLPYVYQSIYHNLISSLCPHPCDSINRTTLSSSSSSSSSPLLSKMAQRQERAKERMEQKMRRRGERGSERSQSCECSYHLYMRISIVDNVLNGLNANGTIIFPKNYQKMMEFTKRALSYFPQSRLFYEISNIGDDNEMKIYQQLEASHSIHGKPNEQEKILSRQHKIFRQFDSRRYNMYLNRWAVYQMMEKNEKKYGYQYDYVIHARLDAAWFAPVPSLERWYPSEMDKDRVIIHDRWAEFVSDTFAILPRKLAKDYYSMDVLVTSGIMCLGGPNFNPRSLNLENILNAGYLDSLNTSHSSFRFLCR